MCNPRLPGRSLHQFLVWGLGPPRALAQPSGTILVALLQNLTELTLY